MSKTDSLISPAVISLEMQEKGKRLIPGLSQLLSKRPDQFAPGIWPGFFEKAKGAQIWDLDGNQYLDMSIGGIGANILGYADPDVDRAVKDAIDCGSSSSLLCPEDVELAELLCELHPWAEQVRYTRTGGEAMAVAVRIARASTKRDKIAICGYHGWHDWYLAANVGTENALGEHLLPGLEPVGVPRALKGTTLPFRYNHFDELEEIFRNNGEEIAAVVMEPLRSEQPQGDFLNKAADIARKNGAVFVFDEISSGFRMNSGGAHLLLGVDPDIAVFSKSIGNGYPMAAVIGRAKIMEASQTSFISSTNWTERIGPTAAIATISKHRCNDVGSHLMKLGGMVQAGWEKSAKEHNLPVHISGIPPMGHFSFETDQPQVYKALFVQLMLERGILATTGFYAMYAHTIENVERYNRTVNEVFGIMADLKQRDGITVALKGKPATAGFKRLA